MRACPPSESCISLLWDLASLVLWFSSRKADSSVDLSETGRPNRSASDFMTEVLEVKQQCVQRQNCSLTPTVSGSSVTVTCRGGIDASGSRKGSDTLSPPPLLLLLLSVAWTISLISVVYVYIHYKACLTSFDAFCNSVR